MVGPRTLVAGKCTLVIGPRILVVGSRTLVVGTRTLMVGPCTSRLKTFFGTYFTGTPFTTGKPLSYHLFRLLRLTPVSECNVDDMYA